jgi:hypothetical protein
MVDRDMLGTFSTSVSEPYYIFIHWISYNKWYRELKSTTRALEAEEEYRRNSRCIQSDVAGIGASRGRLQSEDWASY